MSTPLSVLALASSVAELRRATLEDLDAILGLLADDPLEQDREGATSVEELTPYRRVFALIDDDPAQLLSCSSSSPSARRRGWWEPCS
ncbi:MAG: hypothetical protein M3Y04_09410 [Actinomycetota bacterium]|nr:hypothetical protein [Actinomycetota bacterium]